MKIMNEELMQRIRSAAGILIDAGAKEVFLFGSAAKGQMGFDSDIDLAVSGLPPGKYFTVMSSIDAVLKYPYDLVDLDEDNPFVRHLKGERSLKHVA